MSIRWKCPNCGSTTYHFSDSRNALVCDGGCGTIVQTDAERDEDIRFKRNMVLAKQHLQVGNWSEAKRLIKPYCSTKPSDKQLYLMLLMAVTKGYSDFLLHNEEQRREAFEYWDKLTRLHCINSTMLDYARRREQYIREEKNILSAKRGVAIGISILISIIAVCLIGSGNSDGSFFLVLSVVSWIISIKYMQKLERNISNTRINNQRGNNPFS